MRKLPVYHGRRRLARDLRGLTSASSESRACLTMRLPTYDCPYWHLAGVAVLVATAALVSNHLNMASPKWFWPEDVLPEYVCLHSTGLSPSSGCPHVRSRATPYKITQSQHTTITHTHNNTHVVERPARARSPARERCSSGLLRGGKAAGP